MTTAEATMNSKIAAITDEQIVAALVHMNATPYTPEKVIVRVALCNEYERRHGGEAFDLLMNRLDA